MPHVFDSLPAFYRGLLPEFFTRQVPSETKATCGSCAMCPSSGATAPGASVDGVERFFRPDTKCCTYYPRLPNYLVGALLADPDPALDEGKRRVRAKIAARAGVGPQWIDAPAKYTLVYDNARHAFGRAASLRCPYYDEAGGGGTCSIWAYREAVCSTFFCKHVAGADGRQLWMSVKSYLALVEQQLSRYALFELFPEYVIDKRDRSEIARGPLTAEDVDGEGPAAAVYGARWREWAGHEEDFYRGCHELVAQLDAAGMERLLGLDGTIGLAVLDRAHGAAIAPALPRALKFNPSATVKWLPDGSVALGAYSEFEAVALPGEAYALLTAFTGEAPVEAVRERLRTERQADLDPDVLMVLYRHRVLVEA